MAQDILRPYGPAKVIIATNVLAHIPDPHDFLKGVRLLLADDGDILGAAHRKALRLSAA